MEQEKDINDILIYFQRRQDQLLPMLHAFQQREGLLSRYALELVADYLAITKSEIYSVVSFYPKFWHAYLKSSDCGT